MEILTYAMKDVLIILHRCGISLYGAKCHVCGKKIYWRKLGGVWKGKDGPVFLCDDASCILLGLLEKDEMLVIINTPKRKNKFWDAWKDSRQRDGGSS